MIDAIVDNDEFNETMIQLERIKREALAFVEDYIFHRKGIKILHPLEYKRRYHFSPLKYFHRELGLEDTN